jgi:hypothetical protein
MPPSTTCSIVATHVLDIPEHQISHNTSIVYVHASRLRLKQLLHRR